MPLLPNSFIKVINNKVVGLPFTLPTNYQSDDGTITNNIVNTPLAVKLALGLYPVIEVPVTYNEELQTCEASYNINTDHVVLGYVVTDKPQEILILDSLKKAELALMQKIDAVAKQYDYDNIAEAGVYASTANVYQAEAQAIVAWSASCWQAFYLLNAVTDVDGFIAALPSLVAA